MTAPGAQSLSRTSLADLQLQVESELRAEDQEALFPLLARLTETAGMVADAKPVDAEYLGEGIRLWERYASEIHSERVQLLSQVFASTAPAKTEAAAPKARHSLRRSHAKPSGETHPETPVEMFSHILADQTRMAERRGAFESLLRDYSKNQYWAREMLAALVRSSAFSDRAWAQYEEEFVHEHFDAHLTEAAEGVIATRLPTLKERRLRLEGDIGAYLAKAVVFAPATAP